MSVYGISIAFMPMTFIGLEVGTLTWCANERYSSKTIISCGNQEFSRVWTWTFHKSWTTSIFTCVTPIYVNFVVNKLLLLLGHNNMRRPHTQTINWLHPMHPSQHTQVHDTQLTRYPASNFTTVWLYNARTPLPAALLACWEHSQPWSETMSWNKWAWRRHMDRRVAWRPPCANMLPGDGVPIMVGNGVTPG